MSESGGADALIDSFSLVAYLPDPLASFVDTLREEIQPGANVRGHLTILPPRKLTCSIQEAIGELGSALKECTPFEVALGEVRKFPVTNVIHLSVGHGVDRVEQLHQHLDRGIFAWDEPYRYEPHVTLAQRLTGDAVGEAERIAEQQWRDYRHSRSFFLERLTLVRYAREGNWRNLQDYLLRTPVAV